MALHLLKKRLIGCANISGPIESLYHWKGGIAKEKEFVLLAKTTANKFDAVCKEVEEIHPYMTPCVIKIPVSSNKKYFDWLKNEL